MIFLLLLLWILPTSGKIYDRCELARELKFVHNAPSHQLATWVCIAEHESQYNTSIVGHLNGDGSGDHGIFQVRKRKTSNDLLNLTELFFAQNHLRKLKVFKVVKARPSLASFLTGPASFFQISDKFWCSPPGKGHACGLTCAELEDDDISDDFICAQRIYKEHKTLSGDGFNAWAVYLPHCKGPKSERYIKGCFNDSEGSKDVIPERESVFAHGIFGRVRGFSTSTEPPLLDPFFTPTTSSVVTPTTSAVFTPTRYTIFTPTTRTTTFTPVRSSVLTQTKTSTFTPIRSSVFTPRRTTALTPVRSSIFTPTRTTTFTPVRSSVFTSRRTSIFSSTPRTTAVFNTPTISTFAPLPSRSTNFGSSRTYFTPTIPTFFSSTTARPSNEPVFIFNGVKWY